MKVLLVSLFHPELVRGGAQQVCYELFEGLKARPDVEPVLLAAVDPSFASLYKSGARITGFDGRPDEYVFLGREYDYTWHRTAEPSLIESFAEFLLWIRPDVVHFHHFLLLGVDLLPLVRRVLPDAKIIFTLHEFLSICAADGQFVRRNDGSLCSHASPIRCHQCFPEHGPEHFFLREHWIKRNFDYVDLFTTPTRFMIDLFDKWGLTKPIRHVTNGQRDYAGGAAPLPPSERRNRFGFFGQFVDNKGVHLLLEAVTLLRAEGYTDFVVELNGGNIRYASPKRRDEINAFLDTEAKRPLQKRLVKFNGPYQVDQLGGRMSQVDWCIVPSLWYETFALVISEAWMFGRPVICPNIGAMGERVVDGRNGLNFHLGSARSLADTMKRAMDEVGLWDQVASGIEPPPPREAMIDGFIQCYRGV